MTTETPLPRVRRVKREELYTMVWTTPMTKLGEELGVSGNGLAKICDRLEVPYPPRGHWAKKAAGKRVVQYKLPARKADIPESVDIHRTRPKPLPRPEVVQSSRAAAEKVEGISVPETMEDLHPRVKAWVAEHKKEQREREMEGRRRGRDSWWARSPIPDLTERDLYRFRVSSAIFRAVEKAGGRIEASPISGRICFLAQGHKVECSIVEKLVKSLKPRDQTRTWTAYPDHHQSGLASSGFLRVTFTTYVEGGKPQWIENDKTKIASMLPEIVGAILAAGPVLERQKQEREDRERRYREEETRRYEARQRKELDDKHWNRFREFAGNWEERARLLVFIAELEARLDSDGATQLGERTLVEWVAWAKDRAEALDPLGNGAEGMFDAISRISRWS